MGVWIETAKVWPKKRECSVTPFVGVWIETIDDALLSIPDNVTPFVGVWIETSSNLQLGLSSMSHPSWVCGLKQRQIAKVNLDWLSHPSWVCGLKLLTKHRLKYEEKSHPSWVCGLKHSQRKKHLCRYYRHTLRGCVDWNFVRGMVAAFQIVTPFVGVWIETFLSKTCLTLPASHPSWVCGLKLNIIGRNRIM